MENKRLFWITFGIIVSIIWLFVTIRFFVKGSDTPPLTEFKIPDETKDFFRKLSSLGDGIIIIINPDPDPTTWGGDDDNYGDYYRGDG